MDLEQDAELHAAFRRGDPEVLARVYLHYLPAVQHMVTKGFAFTSRGRVVRSRGFATSDVEDIVQEVFARAFTQAARCAYDGVRPYRSYLLAIARNFVVQRARAIRGVTLPFDERALSAELIALAPTPERLLEARQRTLGLHGFIDALAADERRFFLLRFAQQQSAERVADELGWTMYRVKRIERRLRKRMMRRLS